MIKIMNIMSSNRSYTTTVTTPPSYPGLTTKKNQEQNKTKTSGQSLHMQARRPSSLQSYLKIHLSKLPPLQTTPSTKYCQQNPTNPRHKVSSLKAAYINSHAQIAV
jgi:hypothetical protein